MAETLRGSGRSAPTRGPLASCAVSEPNLWLNPNDNVDGVACHEIGFDIVVRGWKVYVSFNMYFVQCLCQCIRRVSEYCFLEGHYNFYTE